MIPFYIFYSMFGFQRTGDQAWAFGDARGRGFMMGATAGRTTLNGEGLQHDDGHSHLLASTIPSVRAYDPAFAYELATIVRDGIERMYVQGEDVFYYVTLYNENYPMPPMPDGVDDGIVRGLYRFAAAPAGVAGKGGRVRLVGSGSILQQVLGRSGLLGRAVRRRGRGLQRAVVPAAPPRCDSTSTAGTGSIRTPSRACPYVRAGPRRRRRAGRDRDRLAEGGPGPRPPWLPADYVTLGTDGFGRSDTREALRALFEIDGPSIAAAALAGLARTGSMPPRKAAKAIRDLGIDPDKLDPLAL